MNNVNDFIAKIIAVEGISIVYAKTKTPHTDLTTRTIYLPVWDISRELNIMIRLHEVGHLLYTRPIDTPEILRILDSVNQNVVDMVGFTINSTLFNYINQVEDCRIEAQLSTKYGGAHRLLAQGHSELFEMNYYFPAEKAAQVCEHKISRLSILAKLGASAATKYFTPNQQDLELLQQVMSCTQEQGIATAFMLYCDDVSESQSPQQQSEQSNTPGDEFEQNEQSDTSQDDKSEQNEQSDTSQDDKSEQINQQPAAAPKDADKKLSPDFSDILDLIKSTNFEGLSSSKCTKLTLSTHVKMVHKDFNLPC